MTAPPPVVTVPLLPGERKFPLTLFAFGGLSLMAHAATFLLFQVSYPPHVTIPPAATQVVIVPTDDPDQQPLLRWIESEDPALIASSAHPVPPKFFELQYEPSYLVRRTAPRTMPDAPERRERPPGPDLNSLIRSALPKEPAPEKVQAPAPTRLILSGGLLHRELLGPAAAWKTAASGPLEEVSILLGVNSEGEVRISALQKSSGDHQTDNAALAEMAKLHFARAGAPDEMTWGFAVVIWGDDAYPHPESTP